MNMTPEFVLQVIIALASGGGAYAAIRADLATLHEKAGNAARTADGAMRHDCARYLAESYWLGIDYAAAYALLKA